MMIKPKKPTVRAFLDVVLPAMEGMSPEDTVLKLCTDGIIREKAILYALIRHEYPAILAQNDGNKSATFADIAIQYGLKPRAVANIIRNKTYVNH